MRKRLNEQVIEEEGSRIDWLLWDREVKLTGYTGPEMLNGLDLVGRREAK